MSETARDHQRWRGAGVVERGGLENRERVLRCVSPLQAALARLRGLAGHFALRYVPGVVRPTRPEYAPPAGPCSTVQRSTPQTATAYRVSAALPDVAHDDLAWLSRVLTVDGCRLSVLALPFTAQAMTPPNVQSTGFDTDHVELPIPPVDVDDETRERMVEVLAAIVAGSTPEEITDYLDDGYPEPVTDLLARPLEREELSAHLDVLLTVLQSPVE